MSDENDNEIVENVDEEEVEDEVESELEEEEEEEKDEGAQDEEKGQTKTKSKSTDSSGKRKKSDSSAGSSSSAGVKKPKKAKSDGAAAAPVDGKDAIGLILNYVRHQNRPYGANQIFENLHGQVKKTAVVKILDDLSETGKISMKAFGKAKVYSPLQEGEVDANQLEKMEKQIEKMEEEYKAMLEEQNQLQKDVIRLESEPSDGDLDDQLVSLEKDVSTKSSKLSKIKSSSGSRTRDEIDLIQYRFNLSFKEWKKRKNWVVRDLFEAMNGEESSLTVAKWMEKIGLETDEDAGDKIKEYEKLVREVKIKEMNTKNTTDKKGKGKKK